jgi:hypothetical protein
MVNATTNVTNIHTRKGSAITHKPLGKKGPYEPGHDGSGGGVARCYPYQVPLKRASMLNDVSVTRHVLADGCYGLSRMFRSSVAISPGSSRAGITAEDTISPAERLEAAQSSP